MSFRPLLVVGAVIAAICAASQLVAQEPPDTLKPAPFDGVENARLADVTPILGTVYHVQGVEVDRDHVWITSVDGQSNMGYLHQFNRKTGKLERELDLTDGERYHAGGFSVQGNSIWVPVAEYKAHSSAVLVEVDKQTLKIKRRIPVKDHIGCVAVVGDTLIAGNWDSEQLYVLDMTGKQVRVIDNPSRTAFQDIKYNDGALVGAGSMVGKEGRGLIEWFAWPSLERLQTLVTGLTDKGMLYTREGMAVHGNDLYFVPEDGPTRLFHFVLKPDPNP